MLTTLIPPTSGTAEVAGASIVDDPAEVRRRIGYIGQGDAAGHSYRVLDELVMQGRFYGLNKSDARTRAAELVRSLDLAGLEADRRGRLVVDENYATSIPHIYAVGDVIGFPALASTSMDQGRLAASHAFDEPANELQGLQPIGIYTIPEISFC